MQTLWQDLRYGARMLLKLDLLPPPTAVALWRGIPTLGAAAHFS